MILWLYMQYYRDHYSAHFVLMLSSWENPNRRLYEKYTNKKYAHSAMPHYPHIAHHGEATGF